MLIWWLYVELMARVGVGLPQQTIVTVVMRLAVGVLTLPRNAAVLWENITSVCRAPLEIWGHRADWGQFLGRNGSGRAQICRGDGPGGGEMAWFGGKGEVGE